MLNPALHRQDLPLPDLHKRKISGLVGLLIKNQLAKGKVKGISNNPHGAEGRAHLPCLDLAEQAD